MTTNAPIRPPVILGLAAAALTLSVVDGAPMFAAFGASAFLAVLARCLVVAVPVIVLITVGEVAASMGHRRGRLLYIGAALLFCIVVSAKLAGDAMLWPVALAVSVLGPPLLVLEWQLRRSGLAPRLALGGAVVLAGGVAAAWWASDLDAVEPYGEVRWLLALVAFLGGSLAVAWAGIAAGKTIPRRYEVAAVALVAVLATIGGIAFDETSAHARAESLFGQVSSSRGVAERPPSTDRDHPADGIGAFVTHHGFGELPPGFDLQGYSVLYVATEALRWDATSVGDPKLKTTPQLQRWLDEGATSYDRAYAPSSGTLQSIAAIFSQANPACSELDVYKPHWSGKLRDSAPRVAEAFRDAGYKTFWIGHAFRDLWNRKALGFEKGFEHIDRTMEMDAKASKVADDMTGDALEAYLLGLPKEERFFGFSMFSGPHYRYVKHYPEMPGRTAYDRYLQEVRKADEQVGKIYRALKTTNRLGSTIVIFTGDHGEEFEEHGKTGHNRTLWEESIHVPLVVWIPGRTGGRVDQPVSIASVLPWLMLHTTDETLRNFARQRAEEALAPLAAATEGAVISEIVGVAKDLAVLVYPNKKLFHDFVAQRSFAVDLLDDPEEKNPRYRLSEDEKRLVGGYLDARAGCTKFRGFTSRKPRADE